MATTVNSTIIHVYTLCIIQNSVLNIDMFAEPTEATSNRREIFGSSNKIKKKITNITQRPTKHQ